MHTVWTGLFSLDFMSKKNTKALLWKIEKTGAPHSSFVFGTMHLRHLGIIESQKMVFEKIDACDAFATEFHLDFQDQDQDYNRVLLPEGLSIKDFIRPKRYQKLKKILKKAVNFNLDQYQFFLPIYITNLLTEIILQKDSLHSLDEMLWQYAKKQDKKMLGIETLEEQLIILQKIDLEYQINSLLSLGKNINSFQRHTYKMMDLYINRDVQQLYKSTKKSIGKLRKLLLYNRNHIMADRIDQIASQQTFFAAIGAGHLAGEKGVLRLLKQKGWKVKGVGGRVAG